MTRGGTQGLLWALALARLGRAGLVAYLVLSLWRLSPSWPCTLYLGLVGRLLVPMVAVRGSVLAQALHCVCIMVGIIRRVHVWHVVACLLHLGIHPHATGLGAPPVACVCCNSRAWLPCCATCWGLLLGCQRLALEGIQWQTSLVIKLAATVGVDILESCAGCNAAIRASPTTAGLLTHCAPQPVAGHWEVLCLRSHDPHAGTCIVVWTCCQHHHDGSLSCEVRVRVGRLHFNQ